MEISGRTAATFLSICTKQIPHRSLSEEPRWLCSFLGKIFLKNKPVSLFVVVGGIVAASALSLGARGVKLLGNVPQGLPPIGLPAVYWHDLNELLPLAFACFLLGAVETAAIGRMFTAKHGGRFDANQEFLALAASNLGRRTRARISDQRRHVAIARQRRRAARAHRCQARSLQESFWWSCFSSRTC